MLPVSTVSQEPSKSSDANNVAQDDRVVAVLLSLVSGLVGGLLDLLLLVLGLLLDLLGSVVGLLLELVLAGLGVGLDRLRFVVGWHRRDVWAVDVDQGVHVFVRVFDLRRCRGAPV